MNIYEIDQAILGLLDPETGEIRDYEAFSELKMAREEKIENAALLLKNKLAEAAAIKAEIDNLTARKRVAENTAKRLKEYLAMALAGEKFSTPRCSISYRKSSGVETDVEMVEWARENLAEIVIEQAPKLDLVGLKKMLQEGMECPFARITERTNIQVK